MSRPFRKITAVIREERLERVQKALQAIPIDGMSVFPVRGFGEYANLFRDDWMSRHLKLEIFARVERAQEIRQAIRSSAGGTMPGDGVIAVLPVESFEHIHQPASEDDNG